MDYFKQIPSPKKIQSNFRVVNTHCFLHCKFRKPWIYYDSLTGTKYTNYKKERWQGNNRFTVANWSKIFSFLVVRSSPTVALNISSKCDLADFEDSIFKKITSENRSIYAHTKSKTVQKSKQKNYFLPSYVSEDLGAGSHQCQLWNSFIPQDIYWVPIMSSSPS